MVTGILINSAWVCIRITRRRELVCRDGRYRRTPDTIGFFGAARDRRNTSLAIVHNRFHHRHVPTALRDAEDLFAVIRERDVLLHHPYDSFDPVVEFISRAADDPNVLAIKQTLYRTGGDSPIVRALARAAENGKQVTAIVELKARFDEASNIRWARTLEQSGVQVIYGLLGLKTHVKALLVVRREKDKLRRYVHLSTGNYNPQTARVYTDLGFFTCNNDFCDDASALFNYLTGYSELPQWRKIVVAPSRMPPNRSGRVEARFFAPTAHLQDCPPSG